MTWQKLGTEFWDDCAQAGLSDAAVRTHAEAIGWLYRVESKDMRIAKSLVARFAGSVCWDTAVRELVAAEFWRDESDAWLIIHHTDVIRQSIAAQQAKRDRDRRAQQAWRKRHA
jgi:hypothetical protein